jgi:hypothetical protein
LKRRIEDDVLRIEQNLASCSVQRGDVDLPWKSRFACRNLNQSAVACADTARALMLP